MIDSYPGLIQTEKTDGLALILKETRNMLQNESESLKYQRKNMTSIISSLKMKKLENLREVSPMRAFQIGLFSDNKQKLQKIKAIPVNVGNLKKLNERSDSQRIRLNMMTQRPTRNQSEKFQFWLKQKKIHQINDSTQIQTVKFSNRHQKSISSTQANSQKLSFSNLSLEESQEQKNYINQNNNAENLLRNYPSLCNLDKIPTLQLQNPSENLPLTSLKIQDFEILNFCGQGSFGAVYIVRHIQTGAVFALKKIMKQKMTSQVDRQCLIREIKIHLKLDHPNIVKFYSVFSTSEAIYLLMELCQSGNLYSRLKDEGSFDQNFVRSTIRQISSAISYLHQKNIIHRDIKAENIVLHDNVAKLCDFGWAAWGEEDRKSLCGTPIYIAPQIVLNESYDNKVDVWSLGVLTYELIYGKIPFEIRCEDDLVKIVNDDVYFPKNKQVSSICKDFILKCLQKDSFKRWDITRLVNHPFLKKE